MTLVDQFIEAASRNRNFMTVPGRVRFVRTMGKHLGRISDPTERERYIQRVAQISGLPVDTIHRQVAAQ